MGRGNQSLGGPRDIQSFPERMSSLHPVSKEHIQQTRSQSPAEQMLLSANSTIQSEKGRKQVRFESDREAYLRRKQERLPNQRVPSMPCYLGGLFGSGGSRRRKMDSDDSGSLSDIGSDSEESGSSDEGCPALYTTLAHGQRGARNARPFEDEVKDVKPVEPPSPSPALHPSLSTVEFPSRGAFTFSEPSLHGGSGFADRKRPYSLNSQASSPGITFNSQTSSPGMSGGSGDWFDFASTPNHDHSPPSASSSKSGLAKGERVFRGKDAYRPTQSSTYDQLGLARLLGLGYTGDASSTHGDQIVRDFDLLASVETLSSSTSHSRGESFKHTQARPSTIPSELLMQIYLNLHPKDFNAARRTCREWMNASLNRSLLVLMLKRGAWASSALSLVRTRLQAIMPPSQRAERETWLLSCILARECALSAAWTGNGLRYLNLSAVPICDHHWGHCPKPLCHAPRRTYSTYNKIEIFRLIAKIDFSDLASGYAPPGQSGGLIFTASICGKYVLVAEGSMIYVYRLLGPEIRAETSIICPRRVLAMTMDTSLNRFAIAALLEGRMGILVELESMADHSSTLVPTVTPENVVESSTGHRQSSSSSVFRTRLYPENDSLTVPETSARIERTFSARSSQDHDTDVFQVLAENQEVLIEDDGTEQGRQRAMINDTWNSHIPDYYGTTSKGKEVDRGIPIESGRRTIYRELCAEDDPPRSVALCPERHCIAFGCFAGLELHWVDSLTGRDINRWFPLTGPSDHLYFIPPRQGVDSARKLRLISSAAHPSHLAAIARRFSVPKGSEGSSGLKSCYTPMGLEFDYPHPDEIPGVCDHYRAVPMSDGYHILFTDPISGMLCLGCDAPLGDPRRLSRKIMLVSPMVAHVPRFYTSSPDTSKGPRIVAAYGDDVVMFSIPSDIFELSLKQQQEDGFSDDVLEAASIWLNWWPKDDIPTNYYRPPLRLFPSEENLNAGPRSIWPLFLRSTHVGTLPGLVELAINDVGGILSIWAFTLNGRAAVWQINGGQNNAHLRERSVARHGEVLNAYCVDADGDVVMEG